MAKSDYIAQGDGPFSDQLRVFKNAIGSYSATLGLTPAQVTAHRSARRPGPARRRSGRGPRH